ncbi:hypothetical protein J0689_27645, partial [Vibrio parahaemolyticus]
NLLHYPINYHSQRQSLTGLAPFYLFFLGYQLMNNSTERAITMTLVPDEQRLDFWINHFGSVKG